jgi:hypothetical protein
MIRRGPAFLVLFNPGMCLPAWTGHSGEIVHQAGGAFNPGDYSAPPKAVIFSL